MKLTVGARTFQTSGSVRCRHCNTDVPFSKPTSVIFWQSALRQLVIEVPSRTILHQCGAEMLWKCDQCSTLASRIQAEVQPMRRKLSAAERFRCAACLQGTLQPHLLAHTLNRVGMDDPYAVKRP